VNSSSNRSNRSGNSLTALLALSLSIALAGCQTEKKPENTSDSTNTKGSTTSPQTGSTQVGGENSAASTSAQALPSVLSDLPQLKPVTGVNLVKLPDTLVICTVNGSPVTVNRFKKEYQAAVISLQSVLAMQPEKMQQLLVQAKQMGLTLTAEEKSKMIESAHSAQALEGKPLKTFLKERNMTEAQFNEQVLNLGLAFKCGAKVIESQLLSELINREIVLKEAHKAGFYQKAATSFAQIKDSKKYKQYVSTATETPDQIREEIISSQMIKLMLDSVAKAAPPASETVVKAEFEANKNRLKHGERVRLSHIVVAAPAVDAGPLKSIRTQLQEQKPELKGADLENEVKVTKQAQYDKAKGYLTQALKGADFKTLADNYTEDEPARVARNGGDLGFMDLSSANGPDQLKIMAAVGKVKAGQVVPEVVETNFGYHVIKVTERQSAGDIPLAEVKKPLEDMISAKNQEKAEIDWMTQHRKSADIKLTDEFNKAVASGAYSLTATANSEKTPKAQN
jgi:parvulin-like peptidyl-prolyl isomerase